MRVCSVFFFLFFLLNNSLLFLKINIYVFLFKQKLQNYSLFFVMKIYFFLLFFTLFLLKKHHQKSVGPKERKNSGTHLFFIIFSCFFIKKSSFLSTFYPKIDVKNYFFYQFYYLFSSFFVLFYLKTSLICLIEAKKHHFAS